MSLSQKTCTPCQGRIPPLSITEAEALLAQAPGWGLLHHGTQLERRFPFKSFDTLGWVIWPRRRVIILTLASAGVTPTCCFTPTRSVGCTKTTLLWPLRSMIFIRTR